MKTAPSFEKHLTGERNGYWAQGVMMFYWKLKETCFKVPKCIISNVCQRITISRNSRKFHLSSCSYMSPCRLPWFFVTFLHSSSSITAQFDYSEVERTRKLIIFSRFQTCRLPICRCVYLSGVWIVEKRPIGSGCCLGWWVGSVEGWVYQIGWRLSKEKGVFWR